MGIRIPAVLIVDDDRHLRGQMALALKEQYAVAEAGSRAEGLERALRDGPDLVLLDLHLPPDAGTAGGMGLLREIHRRGLDSLVVVMTGDDSRQAALRAIDAGAYDFFRKPVDLDELKLILRRALEKQRIERENRRLRDQLSREAPSGEILGRSPAMRPVFDAIRRVAGSDATVILRGESGTGKELVAHAIHRGGDRKDGPFVAVQCSALPEPLIESELFGHERGAFTGAVAAREGRFEIAHRGTLFLDEIGTLCPALQSKLLRVLETRQFERVGGRHTLQVDVRLISATNEDLEARIREGRFREDLYYRLNVFPIHLPPLRERRDDIPLLVDHFLALFCRARGAPVKKVAPEAMERLAAARWKGNVRELENVVQNLVLRTDGDLIGVQDLPSYLLQPPVTSATPSNAPAGNGLGLEGQVERYERELLESALARSGGVKIEAARLLGIDKNRMMYLCRKHHL